MSQFSKEMGKRLDDIVAERKNIMNRVDKRFTQWSEQGVTSYWKITSNSKLKV